MSTPRKTRAVLRHLGRIALSLLVIFALYEIIRCASSVLLPTVAVFLPSSIGLLAALIGLLGSSELWHNIAITTGRICISLALTIVAGAAVGLGIGSFPRAYRLVRPGWDFLRSIPPSALFPFLVLLLGIGAISKIATTWFTATLIYSLGVADAAATTREIHGRFFSLVGVRRIDWYLAVLLPESLLRSVSALRIVVSITVALMIVCEMFLGAVDGFGGMIIGFTDALRYDSLLAAILLAGMIGFCANSAVDGLERYARQRVGSKPAGPAE